MYFVFVQLLSSGSAWFAIIIIVITCLFPDVVKKVFYRHLQPTNTQKSQVMHRGRAGSQAEAFLCSKCVSLIILPEPKKRVNLLFTCYRLTSRFVLVSQVLLAARLIFSLFNTLANSWPS